MKITIKIFILTIVLCSLCVCANAEWASVNGDLYQYDVLEDETVKITDYKDRGEKTIDLIIPDLIDGKYVTAIAEDAFEGIKAVSVQLPKYVTKIEDKAFWRSHSVKKIVLPEEYNIAQNVFRSLGGLIEIEVLGDNTDFTTIDGVLYRKSDKRLICYPNGKDDSFFEIPTGIKIISDSAFYNNDNLQTVVIPKTVVSIEDYAFYNCGNLAQASIPAELEYLGKGAFSYTQINNVFIGPNLIEIGDNPFEYVSSIKIQVDKANPHFYIENRALIDGDNKTLILLPFSNSDWWGNYTIPAGIQKIGGRAFSLSRLESITIPNTVIEIGEGAFYFATMLKNIYIPEGVKRIGAEAFIGTGQDKYTIPVSVEFIGKEAFSSSNVLNVYHNSEGERFAMENGIFLQYLDDGNPQNDDISWLTADP